ncbi:hypothetical protein SD80_011620 [Scytonema tolypothrichoides VB-61278]|nr:hypothetical protein SD80_011620 [Scytonema tolypothrichoides VB-61278]
MSNELTNLFEVKPSKGYLVFHPEYGKIAKNATEAAIIGGYHYDYLGKQKLSSFTVDGIYHYLEGCAALVTVKRILKT